MGFEEMIAESDVLSLHAPLTEETRRVVGPTALDAIASRASVVRVVYSNHCHRDVRGSRI